MCTFMLQFVFPSLLKSAYKYWCIIYSKQITTTTTTIATTTNDKVNANPGPGPVIQIIGQGRKYKYKLRRQDRYMQTQAPGR